jgi:ribosomal protein S18 acetylase RimI-like enzyme
MKRGDTERIPTARSEGAGAVEKPECSGTTSKRERHWISGLKTPEKQDAGEKLLQGFEAFREAYGTVGVRRLTDRLKESGMITMRDVQKTMEDIPSREEFRTQLLDVLQQIGCLRKERNVWIADLDAIRSLSRKALKKFAFRQGGRFDPYFEQGFPYAAEEALSDLLVVSKEDWSAKKRTPIPLFYQPENSEAAFDPKRIRTTDAYLGYWMFRNMETPKDKPYPGLSTDAHFHETAIAALIYHPRFGNGRRTKDGSLLVYDPTKEKYVPITSKWFTHTIGFGAGSPKHTGDSLHTPVEFLLRHGQRLEASGTLKREDFRQNTIRASQDPDAKRMQFARAERTRISPSGEIMIYGVLHYLGRKFADGSYKVYEIAPDMGGIVRTDGKGNEKLEYTFTLYQPDDQRLSQLKFGKGKKRGRAGADLTNVRLVSETTAFRQDERIEAIRSRTLTENFQSLLHLSNDLWRAARIRLADLAPTSQSWIMEAAGMLTTAQQKEVVEFSKKYGLDGIRAFLSSSVDPDRQFTGFPALEKRLGPPLMRTILARYNEILRLSEQQTPSLIEEVFTDGSSPNIEREKLEREFVRRAAMILEDASKTSQEPKVLAEQILKRLDRYSADLVLFASVFKTAFKGKRRVPFEELKGVEFATKRPNELMDAEREDMLKIAEENWKDVQLKHAALTSLEEKLNECECDTRFYLLKKDGELIGFLRFDGLPDGSLYAGSLNISPAMRGSAIGEALLNEVLAREGSGRPVHAHADPRADVLTAYVERFGFVIEGTEDVEIKPGEIVKGVRIRKDPESYEKPASMDEALSQQRLLAMQAGHAHAPFAIQSYDLKRDADEMLGDIERETARGKAVTRFFENKDQPGSRVAVFDAPPAPSVSRAA